MTHSIIRLLSVGVFVLGFGGAVLADDNDINLKKKFKQFRQKHAAPQVVMRQYYLTPEEIYDGASALQACASGYHMASLWEIFDTSNLAYDTNRGWMEDDSGSGPPIVLPGWVRTGAEGQSGDGPGEANCNTWTSNDGGIEGSAVRLDGDWDRDTGLQRVQPWRAFDPSCDTLRRVWCVEDVQLRP